MSQSLTQFREQKDQFMKQHAQSPIPPEKRSNFEGLVYFDHNPALDLTLEAEEFETKQAIQMQTSTGDLRHFLRWGQIQFEVNGQNTTLILYFSPDSGHFFLPFTDATSGDVTYRAGRYLDVEQVDDGVFHVDFNRAYSPFCAYNERYSCPIPPAENRLQVPIEAGEKKIDLA